jgi:hypothetical protein
MGRSILLAGVAGGITLYVYSAFAWMVLPWNEGTLKPFPNELLAAEAMSQVTRAGMYIYPGPQTNGNGSEDAGPTVFAAVRPGPPRAMAPALGFGFLIDLTAALAAAWLLAHTSGLGYWRKVGFVAMLGLLASVYIDGAGWTWFGYSGYFALVHVLDTTLSFGLAGLAMARIVKAG